MIDEQIFLKVKALERNQNELSSMPSDPRHVWMTDIYPQDFYPPCPAGYLPAVLLYVDRYLRDFYGISCRTFSTGKYPRILNRWIFTNGIFNRGTITRRIFTGGQFPAGFLHRQISPDF